MINLAPAPPWHQVAACRRSGVDRAWFFPHTFADRRARLAVAKAFAVCAVCPVVQLCLTSAVERREPAGVFGGRYFGDGKPSGSERNQRLIREMNALTPSTEIRIGAA